VTVGCAVVITALGVEGADGVALVAVEAQVDSTPRHSDRSCHAMGAMGVDGEGAAVDRDRHGARGSPDIDRFVTRTGVHVDAAHMEARQVECVA